ncbi:MAG TPA: hypothetical protein VIW29_18590 [Polyangiaceae bacterium]
MSRLRSLPALVLAVAAAVAFGACSDEGEPLPARCTEPKLPVFDYRAADPPDDDNLMYPCVTPVGHAIGNDGSGGSSNPPPVNEGGAAGEGGSAEGGAAGAAGTGMGGI